MTISQATSDLDWRVQSKCQELTVEQHEKLFFPKAGRSIEKARRYCKTCPVNEECLEFAINNDCWGIWAGTNQKERREMKNFKQLASQSVPTLAPVIQLHKRGKRKRTSAIKFS